MLASAIFLPRNVLYGNYMKRIERGNFTVGVKHGQAISANQHEFGMGYGVLMSIRSPQTERLEPSCQPLPHSFHVHVPIVCAIFPMSRKGKSAAVVSSY